MPITTNVLGGGIAFNEWLPSSFATDYNGDTIASGANDSFVEIVNTGAGPIDISGYRFYTFDSDAGLTAVAYTVPPGTFLAAGEQFTLVSNNAGGTGSISNVTGPSAIANFDIDETSSLNWILADPSGNFIVLQESGGDGFLAQDLADAGLNPANQVGIDVVNAPTGGLSVARTTDGDSVFVDQNPSPGDPNCFLAGTQIDTAYGPRPVEQLAPGDQVLTVDGRSVPVLWVGRQTVLARFSPAERLKPVRIAAGALGGGLPRRDLYVTADHALSLDGVLVTAGALVGAIGITAMPVSAFGGSYTVYHIETQAHEIILAEGAPAETYIDYVGRRAFENYDEYVALHGAERSIPELRQPRVTATRQLPSGLRARLHLDCVA